MWEKKKKPTFLHTKGRCWLIALGNTRGCFVTQFSIQGPLLSAAVEEEKERKKEWKWIQDLFTEKCPAHLIRLLSPLVKNN